MASWVAILLVLHCLSGGTAFLQDANSPNAAPDASTKHLRDFVLSFQDEAHRGVPLVDANNAWPSVQRHLTDLTHSSSNGGIPVPVLKRQEPSAYDIDMSGKVAFVAGVADASGFGWAIAKALHRAGATIVVGSWVPLVGIFEKQLASGAFDSQRMYDTRNGGKGMLDIAKVYPLDVTYDSPDDIPAEVRTNRRFAPLIQAGRGFTIADVAAEVAKDFGSIDCLVHSIANGPEVSKPLLRTSRKGYADAQASSAYSLVSMVQRFAPIMPPGSAVLSLTYIASERIVPGYGGGMSSAKAALESDTRTLAFEIGRSFGIRINTISAGPLKSRAATAIKKAAGEAKSFIEYAIAYSKANAPLTRDLPAEDVADPAVFLLSPLARAITGTTLYVDNGLNVMGMVPDSMSLRD